MAWLAIFATPVARRYGPVPTLVIFFVCVGGGGGGVRGDDAVELAPIWSARRAASRG